LGSEVTSAAQTTDTKIAPSDELKSRRSKPSPQIQAQPGQGRWGVHPSQSCNLIRQGRGTITCREIPNYQRWQRDRRTHCRGTSPLPGLRGGSRRPRCPPQLSRTSRRSRPESVAPHQRAPHLDECCSRSPASTVQYSKAQIQYSIRTVQEVQHSTVHYNSV